MTDLWLQFVSLVNGFKLTTLVLLIFGDTVLGIVVAIKKHEFAWSRLTHYLNSSILPLIAGYFATGVIAVIEPKFGLAVPATWLLIDTKLIADIGNKLKALGVPIPEFGH